MPKPSSFPILLDQCKTLEISYLKENGYLKPNTTKTGTVSWSREGRKTGSISITSYTYSIEKSYVVFLYTANTSEKVEYRVYLQSKPSNLGKGVVWYFICPKTNKLCRKLYLAGKYFLHREAFENAYYEKQIFSHKTRDLIKIFDSVFTDKTYGEYYKKYRKKHYKGKLTKKEMQFQKKMRTTESYPSDIMERLMMS